MSHVSPDEGRKHSGIVREGEEVKDSVNPEIAQIEIVKIYIYMYI